MTPAERAIESVTGLSVGDAFGQCFFSLSADAEESVFRGEQLCAIIGGVVACYTGATAIPHEWISRREPLPA